jgi:hypothetical protein
VKQRVAAVLADRARRTFVGRAQELALLSDFARKTGPGILFLQGISGIGKSRLLSEFARRTNTHSTAVILLDCRAIEPTEHGFLHALSSAIGRDIRSADDAAKRLAAVSTRVLLALDHYEVFRLLDSWLRQTFIPRLPSSVRLLLAGREQPVPAWFSLPGMHGLFQLLELNSLPDRDAIELLSRHDIPESRAARLNQFACGHPLALTLAASALAQRNDPVLEDFAIQRVVRELTRLFLADISDPVTLHALEAASVVRRATISLLRALVPESPAKDVFDRLLSLPFVHIELDGLHVHDSVKQVIAAALKAADPVRYRELQHRAWSQLRNELPAASSIDLWRYTADMLYLLENPNIREAFFPTSAQFFTVEPASPQDGEAIRDVAESHEKRDAAKILRHWWTSTPEKFSVVRNANGKIVGFYCLFDPETLSPDATNDDPVARTWLAHLKKDPIPDGQSALFLRRWLGDETGEDPSAVQAACWLDIKRTYVALRPRLRRVYLTVRDLSKYARVAQMLGFRVLENLQVSVGNQTYCTAMLDFGPGSVDGWLASLVGSELGVPQQDLLDVNAKELVVAGRRVALTKLEFSVMNYLREREGKAVDRATLIEDVWGYKYDVGSNVVDAVVKGLRKKLAEYSHVIETVPGFGYRFRRDA